MDEIGGILKSFPKRILSKDDAYKLIDLTAATSRISTEDDFLKCVQELKKIISFDHFNISLAMLNVERLVLEYKTMNDFHPEWMRYHHESGAENIDPRKN